jgi:hypothetical protein
MTSIAARSVGPHTLKPALDSSLSGALVLWAESPEEARMFLHRIASDVTFPKIAKIFVAKRSGKVRSNSYTTGEYWPTSDDDAVDVYREAVGAPSSITELVQWCTCDVMLSWGDRPIVVIEDTTHIVRMNLFQRYARLARAASLGVSSAVLQGTRGLDLSKRGDMWGLHRYLAAFQAMTRVHPRAPTLPLWYVPEAGDESRVVDRLIAYVRLLITGDFLGAKAVVDKQLAEIDVLLAAGVQGERVRDVPSIDYTSESDVVVRIGANPNVKSWREKGSGQMDPYVGMIMAAKYLHCYDQDGKQVRRLRVDFTKLPPDFWFFRDGAEATALYKRLPFEFADEVRFLG